MGCPKHPCPGDAIVHDALSPAKGVIRVVGKLIFFMADLLFELGCEELPASAVRRAGEQLKDGITGRLSEAGLSWTDTQVLGTPRRLIVGVFGLPERQADSEKRQRGPALKAAFTDSGEPSGALLGFCRGQGVDVSEVEREGEYVWVTKKVDGLPTAELLAEILPASVRAMTFDKTMRWGSSRMRFSRPIRWIVALLDGVVVPLDIEGVAAANESRGHRFRSPDNFAVASFQDLVEGLRARFVEPDPAVREQRIREQAVAVSAGRALLSDSLIDENVFLTEWPECLLGDFPESYLELPRSVLVTAMAKHEKMFPVEDETGRLQNAFVWVRNSGEEETVRAGNRWVLNARFNDAKFFYDEDARYKLDDFLARAEQMTFQEKLGSVRQRADRLASLAGFIAEHTGASPEEAAWASQAGLYAKADLSSGLVGELASLQGIVGGDYARRENMAEPVCHAIATQYDLGKNPAADTPEARTALRLIMADQIDKLVGFLGIGQVPSGSSDPFGLRRAATILIESAWIWPASYDYREFFVTSLESYRSQGFDLASNLWPPLEDIFTSRLQVLLAPRRYDAIEAALTRTSPFSANRVRARADAMAKIAADPALVSTLSRPLNILAAAQKKGMSPGCEYAAELLATESEKNLIAAVAHAHNLLDAEGFREDPDLMVEMAAGMAPAINAFFDTTMVMAKDEAVRDARLALLNQIWHLLEEIGDVSKLVPDNQP